MVCTHSAGGWRDIVYCCPRNWAWFGARIHSQQARQTVCQDNEQQWPRRVFPRPPVACPSLRPGSGPVLAGGKGWAQQLGRQMEILGFNQKRIMGARPIHVPFEPPSLARLRTLRCPSGHVAGLVCLRCRPACLWALSIGSPEVKASCRLCTWELCVVWRACLGDLCGSPRQFRGRVRFL